LIKRGLRAWVQGPVRSAEIEVKTAQKRSKLIEF